LVKWQKGFKNFLPFVSKNCTNQLNSANNKILKKIILLTLLLAPSVRISAQHQNHQPQTDTSKTTVKPQSPKMTAMAMVGTNPVHVEYGSPSVRAEYLECFSCLQSSMVIGSLQSYLDRFWSGCDG
jgi:hypothetical protein